MGVTTIEWTHRVRENGSLMPGYTANLWWGCTPVHSGCDFCYAEVISKRWDYDVWGNDKPRRLIQTVFNDLLKAQRGAAFLKEIHLVFVGSMMDIGEKSMPLKNPTHLYKTTGDMRSDLFRQIGWGLYPNLFFLFLTKRPSNIPKVIPEEWIENPPSNMMWITSVSDQETADILIPQLLKIKGKKGLSVEPQLGPIDLNQYLSEMTWVIQGGESGQKRRPFNLDWAISMREQCASANVPYFFKQIDKVIEIPEKFLVRQFPKYE